MTAVAPAATRPIALVFGLVLADLIGFGIVLPLLPSYAARFTDHAALIGVLVATDSAMQFLLAPWWGRLSDRIGRRPVLLVALAGSVAGYLLFGLAGSLAVLFLSRLVAGATGATVNVAQAYLADVTAPERRAHAMGVIGAAYGLGFTIGPALGGAASALGDAAPGLLAAALSALNFALAWWRLPETPVHVRRTAAAPADWRPLARPFAAMLLVTLAFTTMYVVFPLYCQTVLGYPRARVAAFFVLLGLVTVVVQGRGVGRLAPRFGEARLVAAGGVLMAAGFAIIPFAERATHAALPVVAGVALLGTGYSLAGPSLAGAVSRRVAAGAQGAALGRLHSIGSVARIIGPPLAGLIQHAATPAMPFLTAAATALAGGMVMAERRDASRAEGRDASLAERRDGGTAGG